jgi:hypothetical protein
MARHTAQAFTNQTVHIDGQTFVDCDFKDAKLVYEGGAVPVFSGCTLADCEWRFEAAADRSLQVLRLMNEIGPAQLRSDIDRLTGRKA